MLWLNWAVFAVSALAGVLGIVYVAKGVRADLLLLGAAALVELAWLVEFVALVVADASGGAPPDALLLYSYLAVGLLIPPGGAVFSLAEQSRWGSLVVSIACFTMAVLQVRLTQIWPGGF